MKDYSKNIYCETWEDENGYRIDVAFTWFEMKEMSVECRCAKREALFEKHDFDYKHARKIREWFFDKENNIQTGEE